MEEVFGRADLIEPARLRALSQKSDARGFVQIGSHFAAILATGVLLWATWGTWAAIPAFLAHGVAINFLYAGQHELSHWTAFRTKALNEWFGRLIGFIVLYPRDFDQIQHFAHHRHTQDWERDGELARPRYTLGSYLWWVLGPGYWYSRISRIVRFTFGIVVEPYVPQERHADVIREARAMMLGYAAIAVASIALQSWAAVTFWLAPMLLTKWVHQLQNTIEHVGLSHAPSITDNTRSTRTNAVMRWLCWNMQYHTAHHAFPGVPFHALPRLHDAIFTSKGREPNTMTYIGFQVALLRALSGGRTEADYPDDARWIANPGEPVAGPVARAEAKAARAA
ncbi:fatty acid desaturase [Zavarzinia sp. CC-PAN008]|uniref:fatty acid desaturase n=1 Tax=Zavarzinia sp. CC-PAN008 TaxID=3243332 RepID=UPI003F749615